MDHKNVKFTAGRHYAKNNWDREIDIVGIIDGTAICQGWKTSYEKIRTDEDGNEYIKIENLVYPAYCRFN